MSDALRQTVRSLRRVPGLTAVVVITFALGIGATTAIYTVVRHVLLRPLPYPEPDQLVQVWTCMPDAGIDRLAVAHAEYLDYRAESRLIEDAGAYWTNPVILTGAGEPIKLVAALTTGSLWKVLGRPATLGRTLVASDDIEGAEPVAVLSFGLWQSRFGGDPGVIGRSIELNGTPRTVVGVMPASFRFPDYGEDLWLPLTLDPTRRGNHHLSVLARMRPGVDFDQVQPEMDAIVARWAKLYTHAHPFVAVPYLEQLLGQVQKPLMLLLWAVAVVLLIASVNVAGLLLARGEARTRELAVRSALGCGRLGLIRQLLGESLLLAMIGGALGIVVGRVALAGIMAMEPGNLPRSGGIALDLPVLLAALAASVVAGLLAGIVPAWRASRPDLAGVLRGSGERTAAAVPGRQKLRSALVVVETAMAVVLVASATLLLRGLWQLHTVDSGVQPDHLITAQITLPSTRYPGAEEVAGFYDRLLVRVRSLPGVRSASLVNSLPMRDTIRMILVGGPWQPPNQEPVGSDVVMVTPEYFETLGNPVLRGRAFSDGDRSGAQRVAALNETAARALFGERDPLGQPLFMVQAPPRESTFEIVAVIRDVPTFGLGTDVRPQVYVPLAQALTEIRGVTRSVSIAARTEGAPEAMANSLRAAIWELDDHLAVSNLETMETVVSASLRPQRFEALLLGLFAGLALVLAAVGLYGLLAHVVGLRRREFGVRLALGARPEQLWRLVLGQAIVLALLGVGIGSALALAAGRMLAGVIYGVSGTDLPSLAATSAVLVAVAGLAGFLPARRAGAVDPAVTLRAD